MRRLFITILMLGTTISILPACGGGGGGGAAAAPSTAIVKLSTIGSFANGTQIGGIDVTLNLPDGVSVKATPDTQNPNVLVTDSGVVAASGVATGENTMAMGTYTTNANTVAVHVANADGFGVGEFVTVTCDIASGATVTAGSFNTQALSAVDLDGNSLSGLTAGFTAEIK